MENIAQNMMQIWYRFPELMQKICLNANPGIF